MDLRGQQILRTIRAELAPTPAFLLRLEEALHANNEERARYMEEWSELHKAVAETGRQAEEWREKYQKRQDELWEKDRRIKQLEEEKENYAESQCAPLRKKLTDALNRVYNAEDLLARVMRERDELARQLTYSGP
jgi:uncharacterized coiled-coil DUF342 family protein